MESAVGASQRWARRKSVRAPLALLLLVMLLGAASFVPAPREEPGHWTLWQLPPKGQLQAMSYVVQTRRGQLMVVDGGYEEDGAPLGEFINGHGGTVEAWFITHPHADHIGALTAVLRTPQARKIKAIYASLPSEEFVRTHEPRYLPTYWAFQEALGASGKQVHDVVLGERIAWMI